MLLHARTLQQLEVVSFAIWPVVTAKQNRRLVQRGRQTFACLAMAPKRKADQTEPDSETEKEKKPRAKASKKKAPKEPYTAEDGWTVVPPSLLFK